MNITEMYKQWKITRQQSKCRRGRHNWTKIGLYRIQCTDPGCGRYLR